MPHRSRSELWAYLNECADEMRTNPTKAELAVLVQLLKLDFKFQYPEMWNTKNAGYGGAVFDFYHPEAQLVVEIDGGSHKRKAGRDRRRDTRFGVEGLRTIRFSNKRALKETEAVIAEIRAEIER